MVLVPDISRAMPEPRVGEDARLVAGVVTGGRGTWVEKDGETEWKALSGLRTP